MHQHYPEIRVQLHSRNPFALVSAVRQALRRYRVGALEIDRFTQEAMSDPEPERMRQVCASWAAVEVAGIAL
jgi:hypothetical protein